MRAKKNLKNNVRFVDDITKQNHELMKRMRDSNRFDSMQVLFVSFFHVKHFYIVFPRMLFIVVTLYGSVFG
jgi:hypothetical protein